MEQKKNEWMYPVMSFVMIGYAVQALYRCMKLAWFEVMNCDSFAITEFLINYQGGYVRRGLTGELLYRMAHTFPSIDPRYYIVSVCLISFCFLIWYLLSNFHQSKLCWWFLPLNVCIAGAFALIRKDFICCVLIICILALYTKIKSSWLRILSISISLIVSLNIHECIFFMIVPFVLLLFLRDIGYNFIQRFVGISIPLICMGIVCLCKGNEQIAESIWNSWCFIYDDFSFTPPQASIDAISWETFDTLYSHFRLNFLTRYFIVYGWYSKPIIWLLVVFIMPNILFRKRNWETNISSPDITRMLGIMMFQFLSLVPMFTLLSCDGSRICFYWTVSTLLIYFSIPHDVYLRIAPRILTNAASYLQKTIFFKKSTIISVLLLLVICISPYWTSRESLRNSVIGTYAQTCYQCLKYLNIIPGDAKLPI